MDTWSRPLKLILQMENLMTTIERENQGLCLCVCVAQQCHLVAYSNITVAALQKKWLVIRAVSLSVQTINSCITHMVLSKGNCILNKNALKHQHIHF